MSDKHNPQADGIQREADKLNDGGIFATATNFDILENEEQEERNAPSTPENRPQAAGYIPELDGVQIQMSERTYNLYRIFLATDAIFKDFCHYATVSELENRHNEQMRMSGYECRISTALMTVKKNLSDYLLLSIKQNFKNGVTSL